MKGRKPVHLEDVEAQTCRLLKRVLESYPRRFRITQSRGGGFHTVRNRLKFLCDLDPVIYRRPRTGRFVLSFEETPAHLPGGPYVCRVRFDDACADPQVTLAFEIDTGIEET